MRISAPGAWLASVVLLAACRTGTPSGAPAPATEAEAAARTAIANERSLDPSTYPDRTLGVTPLAVNANDTLIAPLGYGLADLLITDLAQSAQLQVVDRVRTDALLRELQLASSGKVDSGTAPRVGKLLGTRRLLVGALTQLPGQELRMDVRIADVPSGTVTASVDAHAPLDRILDAEKALAFDVLQRMGITLTPSERQAIEQRPTKDVGALLAFSRGARAEAMGDWSGAAMNYRAAANIDPGFTMAATRASSLESALQSGQPLASRGARNRNRAGALRRAGFLTMGNINYSLAQRLRHTGANASDAAFEQAHSAIVVVVVQSQP